MSELPIPGSRRSPVRDGVNRDGARTSARRVSLLLWLLAASCGCQATLRVTVQSAEMTNGGQPLYMMVAAADEQTALLESYEHAAERLFRDPRDKTIIHRVMVFPGNNQEFTVTPPETEGVGLYVFFTNPQGQSWRHVLHPPVPSDVVVELGNDAIHRVVVGGK